MADDAEQGGSITPAEGEPQQTPGELASTPGEAARTGPRAPGDPAPAEVPTSGEQAAAPAPTKPAGAHAVGEPPSPKAGAKTWRPWTISVAALLALLVSLVLAVGDALAGVLCNLGGCPASSGTFARIAVGGHGALALASAALFGAGLANAARRRAATLATWAIIPIGVGWFFLMGRLAAG